MPRQKPADKVEMLRRQQADIATKLKEAETRAREKKRDDEQRRERVVGRCILARLDREPESAWSRTVWEMLDGAVNRSADRVLFPHLDRSTAPAQPDKTVPEHQDGAAHQTL